MYFMGIDIGSLSCDSVLIDESADVLAASVVPTGARNIEAIKRATRETLDQAGVSESDVVNLKSQIISKDIVAVDAAAAKLFGNDPAKIKYIAQANAMNLGEIDLAKLKINRIIL